MRKGRQTREKTIDIMLPITSYPTLPSIISFILVLKITNPIYLLHYTRAVIFPVPSLPLTEESTCHYHMSYSRHVSRRPYYIYLYSSMALGFIVLLYKILPKALLYIELYNIYIGL